jgi:hypothetical protein
MKLHAKITTTTMDIMKWEREQNVLSFRNCRKYLQGLLLPSPYFVSTVQTRAPVNRTHFVL